ncbi:MAG: alkaline phosphatase family protein [Armatimonadetes bacterium]|nr:alkaline phosphatase family protein [Armatimonadota bacterium]
MTKHETIKEKKPRGDGALDPGKRGTLKKLAALGLLAVVDAGALSSCGRYVAPSSGGKRVLILGLDGLDPRGLERMMTEGKLPNFSRLREMGGYSPLGSSNPPQSPVAWASFISGRDPGGHGIYDFIQRDPKTYIPYLSIAETIPPEKTVSLGQWRVPLSGGEVRLRRRGRAFWDVLAERDVPAAAYRVPSNYPPQDTGVKQLAGLGAPDLRGTYGEFSFYTDVPPKAGSQISGGGDVYQLHLLRGSARVQLYGPSNDLREGNPRTSIDFDLFADRDHRLCKINVQGRELVLREGEWSDWVPLRFEMIPYLKSVAGICRFFVKSVKPYLQLYVTPINIDPRDPALPITAPASFASELADKLGPFYTQGFPHDVKALRHEILSDEEYLQQSDIAFDEERRMFDLALHEFDRGLLFYYFATTDRTQHMFWRTMDPAHPAHDPSQPGALTSVIEDCYAEADKIVQRALEVCDDQTTLVVLSDHGFGPYYRSFNLNSWLAQHDYLPGVQPWGGKADIFSNADWQQTLAYGIGFNALYLNLAGREPYGIVGPEERTLLEKQLVEQLREVRDPETGDRVIADVYPAREVYSPDDSGRAPDLVVGYARGYRCSDDSVLGTVTDALTAANTDKWSGDHCIDRSLVPGILLSNKHITAERPALTDVTVSVLEDFGADPAEGMSGRSIW